MKCSNDAMNQNKNNVTISATAMESGGTCVGAYLCNSCSIAVFGGDDFYSTFIIEMTIFIMIIIFLLWLWWLNHCVNTGDREDDYNKMKSEFLDRWKGWYFTTNERSHDSSNRNSSNCSNSEGEENDDDDDSRGCYVDYAGSALPPKYVLYQDWKYHSSSNMSTMANPHSSSSSNSIEEQTKQLVLEFLGALPNSKHCGYQLYFTSGTTESCRLLAECFPFTPHQSHFYYSHNVHTSVLAMRNIFLQKLQHYNNHTLDASGDDHHIQCHHLDTLEDSNGKNFNSMSSSNDDDDVSFWNLLAVPLECNLTGRITNVKDIQNKFASTSNNGFHPNNHNNKNNNNWKLFLDIAKAAATMPIDLNSYNPDFAAISFYKIFGIPTGLGALLVKNNNKNNNNYIHAENSKPSSFSLRSPTYVGGGGVELILPYNYERTMPKPQQYTNAGTCHFRGIHSLFNILNQRKQQQQHSKTSIIKHNNFDMNIIHRHAMACAHEFVTRCQSELFHTCDIPTKNNIHINQYHTKSAIRFYGPWAKISMTGDCNKSIKCGPTVAFNILRPDGISFVGISEVYQLAQLHRIQLRVGCCCNPGACHDILSLTEEDIFRLYETSGFTCGNSNKVDFMNDKNNLSNNKESNHSHPNQLRPAGVVRVSFGNGSTYNDVDTLVEFLKTTFVRPKYGFVSPIDNHHHHLNSKLSSSEPIPGKFGTNETEVTLTEQYIFPIKSCRAVRVREWYIHRKTGKLKYDRELALIDAKGQALRLCQYPRMGHIQPSFGLSSSGDSILYVSAPDCKERLRIDLSHPFQYCNGNGIRSDDNLSSMVSICGNQRQCYATTAFTDDEKCHHWFTSYLGVPCWLTRYKGNTTKKKSLPQLQNSNTSNRMEKSFNGNKVASLVPVSFANEAPLLLVTQDSVEMLNQMIKRQRGNEKKKSLNSKDNNQVCSLQFRPNWVVKSSSTSIHSNKNNHGDLTCRSNTKTTQAFRHIEDSWSKLTIISDDETKSKEKLALYSQGPCARCSMVDLDPQTGLKKGQTLRALSEYRRQHGQISFGIFLGTKNNEERKKNEPINNGMTSSLSSQIQNKHDDDKLQVIKSEKENFLKINEGCILDINHK